MSRDQKIIIGAAFVVIFHFVVMFGFSSIIKSYPFESPFMAPGIGLVALLLQAWTAWEIGWLLSAFSKAAKLEALEAQQEVFVITEELKKKALQTHKK